MSDESPFGVLGADCQTRVHDGPGWDDDVACPDLWQPGKRLPEGYRGCANAQGEGTASFLAWCEDDSLEGSYSYENMYARAGQVIVEVPVDPDSGDPLC